MCQKSNDAWLTYQRKLVIARERFKKIEVPANKELRKADHSSAHNIKEALAAYHKVIDGPEEEYKVIKEKANEELMAAYERCEGGDQK